MGYAIYLFFHLILISYSKLYKTDEIVNCLSDLIFSTVSNLLVFIGTGT